MFNAGTVTANITANTVGFDRGISRAEKGASKLGSVFGTVARTAAAVGAVAVGAGVLIGRSAVKSAIDLEQTSVAFEVMLGSAEEAKKTLAALTEFAKTTPFELPEIQTAAKSLLAFGFEADQLEPTLRSLGDVSAGLNIPIGEMSELYGKARTQGRLFAEDVNQLTGRGIPIIAELAKQFNVSESEVRKLVETGQVGFENLETAMQSMTSEGGQFFGLMEKQSLTFGGTISNLKDSFGLLTRAIVGIDPQGNIQPGGLFDQFKGLAFNLLTILNDNKDTIINIAQNALTKLFDALSSVGKLVLDVTKFFMDHKDSVNQVKDSFHGVWDVIQNQLIPTIVNNKDMFIDMAKVLGTTVALAFIALGEAIQFSLKQLNNFIDKAGNVYTFFKDNLPAALGASSGSVDSFISNVSSKFSWIEENMVGPFQRAHDRIKSILDNIPSVPGGSAIPFIGGGVPFLPGINTGGIVGADSILKFASGGVVPGKGSRDSVLAALTPGELVINPQRQGSVDTGMDLLNGRGKSINLNGPINISNGMDLNAMTYELGLLYKTL